MEGNRPLAIVTGASSGIGLHLALEAAVRGYDLILAADQPLEDAAANVRTLGAQMVDTAQEHKADPAAVARTGFDAMLHGDAHVVAGVSNKLRVALSGLVPDAMLAEQHRKMAEPGTARH